MPTRPTVSLTELPPFPPLLAVFAVAAAAAVTRGIAVMAAAVALTSELPPSTLPLPPMRTREKALVPLYVPTTVAAGLLQTLLEGLEGDDVGERLPKARALLLLLAISSRGEVAGVA